MICNTPRVCCKQALQAKSSKNACFRSPGNWRSSPSRYLQCIPGTSAANSGGGSSSSHIFSSSYIKKWVYILTFQCSQNELNELQEEEFWAKWVFVLRRVTQFLKKIRKSWRPDTYNEPDAISSYSSTSAYRY